MERPSMMPQPSDQAVPPPPQQSLQEFNRADDPVDDRPIGPDLADIRPRSIKPRSASSGGGSLSHKRDDEVDPNKAATMKLELSSKQKEDIKQAFNAFDANGTGFMSTLDLKIALRALGFEPRKNEIKKIVEKIDSTNTGRLCFTDFLEVITFKLAEKDTRDEIMKAFKLFDKDHTGYITFDNLKVIASELGEALNDEEIKEMIDEADRDLDGAVSSEEFFRIMKKTSLY